MSKSDEPSERIDEDRVINQLRTTLSERGPIEAAMSIANEESSRLAFIASLRRREATDWRDIHEIVLLAGDIYGFRKARRAGHAAHTDAWESISGLAKYDADVAADFFWTEVMEQYPASAGPPWLELLTFIERIFTKVSTDSIDENIREVDRLIQRHFVDDSKVRVSEIRKKTVEGLLVRGETKRAEAYLLKRGRHLIDGTAAASAMWSLVADKSQNANILAQALAQLTANRDRLLEEETDWVTDYRKVVDEFLWEHANSLRERINEFRQENGRDQTERRALALDELLPATCAALADLDRWAWRPAEYGPLLNECRGCEDTMGPLVDKVLFKRSGDHLKKLSKWENRSNISVEWLSETIDKLKFKQLEMTIAEHGLAKAAGPVTHTLIVEGVTDKAYIELAADVLGIDISVFEIDPAHGACEVAINLVLLTLQNRSNVTIRALFDDDESGKRAYKFVSKEWGPRGQKTRIQKNKNYFTYRRWFKADVNVVEAEDLFPDAVINAALASAESEDAYISAKVKRKGGGFRYELNADGKQLLIDWLKRKRDPDHFRNWQSLLETLTEVFAPQRQTGAR